MAHDPLHCAACGGSNDPQPHRILRMVSDVTVFLCADCRAKLSKAHGDLIREGMKGVDREVFARGGRAAAAKVSLEDKQRRGRAAGAARRAKIADRDRGLMETIQSFREEGVRTFTDLADALTKAGIKPPLGEIWYPSTVSRLIKRMEEQ